MKKRVKLNKEKAQIACTLLGKSFSDYKLQEGRYYRIRLTDDEFNKVNKIYNDSIKVKENKVKEVKIDKKEQKEIQKKQAEFEEYQSLKSTDFSYHKIDNIFNKESARYAIALFSDVHLEETVESDSVLGLNEYNLEVASDRVLKYFGNLTQCLVKDKVATLIFSMLGDSISGFIHDELSQCNGLTPPEAILKCQSLIVSGLKFICDTCKGINIECVAIVGNHSRSSKKIQHSNGYKLSYEWIMYNNIKGIMEQLGYNNIHFIIPKSEMVLLEMPDKKRFIFIHGFQIKSGGTGTVCGIYPSLQRLAMKWDRVFRQDKIYLGHFHSCISIPTATVNGSIIGYNAYAMSNGFSFEEPAQMYELYDSDKGLLLTRKIYCK